MSSALVQIERIYGQVGDCPPKLAGRIITLPLGTLTERVQGILEWRRSLLDGQIPDLPTWPPSPFREAMLNELDGLDATRFLAQEEELVDRLLMDMLDGLRAAQFKRENELLQILKELESLERMRLAEQQLKRTSSRIKSLKDLHSGLEERSQQLPELAAKVELSAEVIDKLRAKASHDVSSPVAVVSERALKTWCERVRQWREIAEVFDELGLAMGRGWDLTRAVLRHSDWMHAKRLARLIQKLPQVRELLQTLGRLMNPTDGETFIEKVFESVRRATEQFQSIRMPDVPPEIHGVTRSGDIARMLPPESVLLGHPKLRTLWHARRSERALLSYRMEGVDLGPRPVVVDGLDAIEKEASRLERGPIVCVVDTSGSMHGAPETVAKALALEAARVAWGEKRRCLLISFGGPGDFEERELSLGEDGIARLLEFIGLQFGGGTDLDVLSHVAERLQEPSWNRADVLLISDGEWLISDEAVQSVEDAKTSGTRFHGVQLGASGETGLHAICDCIHDFSNWLERSVDV